MVPRNLCGRTRQGQQTPRRPPECHRPAAAPVPEQRALAACSVLRRAAAARCGRCRWSPRARSCRTTSRTTSRAIPLDRNRPARGAGRTLDQPADRTSTTSVATRQFPPRARGAPTPRTMLRRTPCPRLTGMTTERSQAASPAARRPRRSSSTAPPSAVACSFSSVCTTPPGMFSAGSRSCGLPMTLKR